MSSIKTGGRTNLILALLAIVLELTGAILQVNEMLNSVGVTSVFSAVSLASADKVNFALYLTFAGATIAIVGWASGLFQKGRVRLGGLISGFGAASGLIVVALPYVLGYPVSSTGLLVNLAAAALTCFVAYSGYTSGEVEMKG